MSEKPALSAAAQQQRDLAVALDAQREAALPDGSAWVGASAGSGKTKVLVDRILRLLLADVAPAHILCLTFTKAAAAEMAKRVSDELSLWAIADDAVVAEDLRALLSRAPTHDERRLARRLFARVLETPGGFKIMTIHAFCQSVLGRFPIEAGLPPHFGVMEARDAAELIQQAQDDVLGAAFRPEHPLHADLVELAVRAGERGFGELVSAILFERFRLHEAGMRGDDVVARVYATLDVTPDDTPQSVAAAACADAAFVAPTLKDLRRVAAVMIGSDKSDAARGQVMADFFAAPASGRADMFDAYLEAFFTDGGDGSLRTRLATKGTLKQAIDAIEILTKEAARLERVRDRRNACAVARATAALLRIGAAVIAAYERLKESRALLDFDDLIFKTNELITERASSAWVLFKLDGGIDHILIDEAQDTSRAQWQVIVQLTEEYFAGAEAMRAHPRPVGRSIFAVGDPKQSIFSFQRAEPASFVDMRDRFAARVVAADSIWRPVDLRVSFRSTRAVLDLVDTVFAREAANDGVALDRAPISHIAFRHGQFGCVEVWPPIKAAPQEDSGDLEPFGPEAEGTQPSVRLANRIASTIKDSIVGPKPLFVWNRRSGGDPVMVPARYGDVMILVRQRGEFMDQMVTALKRAGVPVAGVDRMVLTEQLAVQDLVALGRFLLLPEDDLNLAALLRSPLFGISEQCLFDLAYERHGATLWRRVAELAGRDAALKPMHETLTQLLARADFVPPYELFADVLDVRGGREKLIARLGPEAQDPIDEFLARALDFQHTHAPSLETFLHWLTSTSEEIKRDPETASRDVVRVLTVHGAKGLEAPIVFLPDTISMPGAQSRPRLLWPEGSGIDAADTDVPLWLPPGVSDCAATERRTQLHDAARMQEYRRLLYVALTRAADRLYVCGWIGNPRQLQPPPQSWYALIAGALADLPKCNFDFGPGWQAEGWRIERDTLGKQDAKAEPFAATPHPDARWLRTVAPAEEIPSRPLAPSQTATEPSARSPFGRDDELRFRRGRLIHRLLQTVPDLPPESRPGAIARFLAVHARDLDAAARSDIAGQVQMLLGHPDFAVLFGPGSMAEVPITGRVGKIVVSGQIDRLVVSPSEVLIVDYKTNRPPPARVEDVAPAYIGQMAAYRALLAEIYPDRPIGCVLLWTDDMRLMRVPDTLLSQLPAQLDAGGPPS